MDSVQCEENKTAYEELKDFFMFMNRESLAHCLVGVTPQREQYRHCTDYEQLCKCMLNYLTNPLLILINTLMRVN